MSEPLRLVEVLPHPDDESGEGAATLARYVAAGHEVMVVTCTGDESSGRNPATEIIGAGHHWLQFTAAGRPTAGPVPPGRFASVPLTEPAERLVRVLREFRPHVVVTCDDTENPHPDFLRCHEVSVAAFESAGDPTRFPRAGAPWQPLKLYYVREWHEERVAALHGALLDAGLSSPFGEWLDESVGTPERVTTRVPCAGYFDVRDRASRALNGGAAGDHQWNAVPMPLRREVWPTEDFELARSHVATSIPEDDLFAGISPE